MREPGADLSQQLVELSRDIHDDPELGFNEHRAARRIGAMLERNGHTVQYGLGGLATAFRASVGPRRPAVVLLAEYDALPDIGHACAHNLIAMTTVGAFVMAAADPLELSAGIALVGTPAEEGGGGKIRLLEAGIFEGVSAAISSHASADANWVVSEALLGRSRWQVTFIGVAAHATVSAASGRNALNGAIGLFNGLAAWSHQWPAGAHVNGIISEGGVATNIIPERAVAQFGLRARTIEELREVEARFADIARGASLQTGTRVELLETAPRYEPPKVNSALAGLLEAELLALGKAPLRGAPIAASSDIGNVSRALPADYIAFPVTESPIAGHSIAMRDAAASPLAHENALLVTRALAAAARRIGADPEMRKLIAAAH